MERINASDLIHRVRESRDKCSEEEQVLKIVLLHVLATVSGEKSKKMFEREDNGIVLDVEFQINGVEFKFSDVIKRLTEAITYEAAGLAKKKYEEKWVDSINAIEDAKDLFLDKLGITQEELNEKY